MTSKRPKKNAKDTVPTGFFGNIPLSQKRQRTLSTRPKHCHPQSTRRTRTTQYSFSQRIASGTTEESDAMDVNDFSDFEDPDFTVT